MQGRVRLRPEVRKLLRHLVERGHELVRSQGNPKVPAATNRPGAGWAAQAPGPPDAGAEDRGRSPQLRAPDGPQHGLNQCAEPHLWRGCPRPTATNSNKIETVPERNK